VVTLETKSAERRRYIRLKAYHLVKYKEIADSAKDSSFVSAVIKDIGGGGVCLRTEQEIPVSTVLELKINFPHISTFLYASVVVVWVRRKERMHCFELGCKFIQISDSLRSFIEEQVKQVFAQTKTKR